MFNDKYGLTKSVLDGRKTMTRRVITLPNNYVLFSSANNKNGKLLLSFLNYLHELVYIKSQYQVGEMVAIAQRYKDAKVTCLNYLRATDNKGDSYANGFLNKMFVKAELTPHHIRITNIRIERLQDISHEDCIREGILESSGAKSYFATLINKLSGKGTWAKNPYVFVYEFELIN